MRVQITRVHTALHKAFDLPRDPHPQAGAAPEPGSTTVRWNSCPRIRVPATASTLSLTATASR